MLRGDDVGELQRRLGALGFDAGRVDGIFGPHTERALVDFQRNVGLHHRRRVRPRRAGRPGTARRPPGRSTNVAGVREREAPALADHRCWPAAGSSSARPGGLDVLVDRHRPAPAGRRRGRGRAPPPRSVGAGGRGQRLRGRRLPRSQPLGRRSRARPPTTRTDGLRVAPAAGGCASSVGRARGRAVDRARRSTPAGGRWLPILRETRMPAVVCELGPPATVVERTAELAAAAAPAPLEAWVDHPVDA